MIAEFNAALISVRLLTQMAKAILDANAKADIDKVVSEFNATLIDLHSRILSIQLQMEELLRVKVEAEEKLKTYEQWEVESTKYTLTELAKGIFAYALKPAHIVDQPAHWLCPKCYQHRKKSILQWKTLHEGKRLDGRVCPECKTTFSF